MAGVTSATKNTNSLPWDMHTFPTCAGITVRILTGDDARHHGQKIAGFRNDMFREFPYLYEGSDTNEQEYLDICFRSSQSVILLIYAGEKCVGFSSIIPLEEEINEIKAPFIAADIDMNQYLYIGEFMVLPAYRKGIKLAQSVADFYEDYAHRLGRKNLVFMTVQRPNDHPMRPANYRSLEPLWRHRGYQKRDDMCVHLSWAQIPTGLDEKNHLDIWEKSLS